MKKSKVLLALNLSLCAFFLIFVSESIAQSEWSKVSTENNEIARIPGSNQSVPAIAKDFNKGVIIVWEDTRNTISNGSDIYGIRIDERARRTWTADGQFGDASEDQKTPSILSPGDGFFYLAWQDWRRDGITSEISVLKYSITGDQPIWGEVKTAHAGLNYPPVLFQYGAGNNARILTASYTLKFVDRVISWQNLSAQNGASRFPQQKEINPNAKSSFPDARGDLRGTRPAVVPALNGGLIAAWTDTRNDTITYITGADEDGNIWAKGEFSPDEGKVPISAYPAIVSDGSQGAIVFWIKNVSGSQNQFIAAARYDSEGNTVWDESLTDLINATPGKKSKLRTFSDGQNGAFLVWQNINTTRPDTTVHIQRIDSEGNFWLGGDKRIANFPAAQLNPVLYVTGDRAIVVWEDKRNRNSDLYAQAFDFSGEQLWPENGVAVSTASGKQTNVVLTADDLGGVIAAWEDTRNGDRDIYAERISKPGVIGEFREISVSSPGSGENWEVGSGKTITWTATEEIERIKIELVIPGQDIITLNEQDNTNATNGSLTINSLPGSASDNCHIRITAVEAPFIVGESAPFTISPSLGPVLIPNETTELNSGDSLRVVTTATDISGVQDVVLNYKIGGGLSYSTIEMDAIGLDTYEATVPPNFVTSRGLSYFVSGTDNIDVIGYSDTNFVSVKFEAGTQVKLVKSKNNGYRMISSPNLLAQTLADSIFAHSGFGAYDTTMWRLYKYENGAYVERDSANADSFRFTPGAAYWLISANEMVLDFGPGVSIEADKAFKIDLKPGWNQIASPFAFDVAWNDVMAESGDPLISVPYEFRGAQYIMPNILEYNDANKHTGFFVYNHEDSVESLLIPPRQIDVNASKVNKITSSNSWQIQILASCDEAKDDYNYIGINESASSKFDRLDLPEPPPFGNYVSVYFPQSDWERFSNNYTTDFRNEIGDGVELTVHVRTNVANSEANIRFDGLKQVPGDLEIMLFDDKLNITQSLRERGDYSFVTGASTTLKELKVLIGNGEFIENALADVSLIPEKFELSQNFPNPFNPTTSIRYGLPAQEKVTIRIYDLLGREVRTLVQADLQKAGYHIASWNGRDKNEIPVASGVYVYHVKAGKFNQSKKMILVK